MNAEEIHDELTAAANVLDEHDDVTVLRPNNQPFEGFVFRDESLESFTRSAIELGINEFYLFEEYNDEGELVLGGVCYFKDGRSHAAYKHNEDQIEEAAGDSVSEQRPVGRDESEEERQRKEEIADELLTEYEDYLNEDDRYRIKNRLEMMRLGELLHLKEEVEDQAKADPEEEKRLARLVYEDERFNRQFNQTDTEMLLEELDTTFDEDRVRFDEVHKRAKSLLKINR